MGDNLLLFQPDVVMYPQFIYWLMDNSNVYIRSIYEANNHSILVDLVPTEELDFNLIEDLLRQPHIWDCEGQSLNISISKAIDIIG